MGRDWTCLPNDLIQLISQRIASVSDFVRFRAVCTKWKLVSLRPQLPWLILPRDSDGEDDNLDSILSMYDLSESKIHNLDLPEIQGKRIRGCSHGWLVLEKEREVCLFNPITGDQISLPSLSARPNPFIGNHSGGNSDNEVLHCVLPFCIKKAILSSDPSMDPDCLVMALFWGSWEVAFCRIGDKCWTTLILKGEIVASSPWCDLDIGYHNGLFYAVHGNGHVWICDIRNANWNYRPDNVDPEEQIDHYICTVEGGCDEHGLMVFSPHYSVYPKYDPVDDYRIFMLSDELKVLFEVEEEHLGVNFFVGGMFHCIALPVANLRLDGWEEGNCLCYISPRLEMNFDDVDWYSCSIKLVRFDDWSVTTLASHLGFFDWKKYKRYNRNPCFLWLTPSLR